MKAKTKPPFAIVSDQMVPFAKEFCEKYLELPKFEGERKVVHEKAENLRQLMFDGQWNEGQGEIAMAVFPDGSEFRVNGQHRCYARYMLDDSVPFNVRIRVVKYRVKDHDEYRLLYITMDNPMTQFVRSRAHLIDMALAGTPEFEGVKKEIIRKVEQGYRGWQYGFNNACRKAKVKVVADALRGEYNKKAREVAEILAPVYVNKKANLHLTRSPVFGAIWETLRFPTVAKEFWQRVIDGLFDTKTDPAKVLCDYLLRTGLGNKTRTHETQKNTTSDEMYAVCVKCFNFYKAGKPLIKTPPSIGPRPVAR